MRATKILTTAAFLAACSVATPAAFAQASPEETRARELYDLGKKHYAQEEFKKAEEAFTAGYALSHRPGFLWNMAQSARLRGDKPRALKLYRKFLKESKDGPERAEAQKWVATLEADLENPNEPAASPAPAAAPTRPSSSSQDATADVQPTDNTLPYVLGGVGIAGLTVGGVAGVLALSKGSTVADECNGAACSSTGKDAADSGKTFATVSNIGFGVGVAGLTAAAVLLLTQPETEEDAHARGWTPTVGYDGRGGWVGASGTF